MNDPHEAQSDPHHTKEHDPSAAAPNSAPPQYVYRGPRLNYETATPRPPVVTNADVWARRRRTVSLIRWSYWAVALLAAAIIGVVFLIGDSISFGIAAWLGTLFMAAVGFIPVWLLTAAIYRGAQASDAARTMWRDRHQGPPAVEPGGADNDLRF